jgi:hypothetical protein
VYPVVLMLDHTFRETERVDADRLLIA